MTHSSRTNPSRHGGWKTWPERLTSGYVVHANGCHIWRRAKSGRGYGVIYFDGKLHLAHRASWLLAHGSWPAPDKVLDHLCENKACVNPAHLQEVENWQNLRRAYRTEDTALRAKRERNRLSKMKMRKPLSETYTPFGEGGGSNRLV